MAEVDNNVFVMDIPIVGGQTPTVSVVNPAQAAIPVRRLTRIGGDFIGWQPDGNRVYFSIGRSYFTYDLPRADSLVRDSTVEADSARRVAGGGAARDSGRAPTPRAIARPTSRRGSTSRSPSRRTGRAGQVVLQNARVVTMKGDEVIERARHPRARQPHRRRRRRGNAARCLTGRARSTSPARRSCPGFVDTHAHMWPDFGHPPVAGVDVHGEPRLRRHRRRATRRRPRPTCSRTATSSRPATFSARASSPPGPGVFWTDDIKSLDDARDVLRRYTEFYNTNTIKQYMVGDRKVRQWVIMAAQGARAHADARGRPRSQEESHRGDRRLRGQRALVPDRAAVQGQRAAASRRAASRTRRR